MSGLDGVVHDLLRNEARHISGRVTPKAAEMAERRRLLYDILAEHHPASVRHLFYLAVVRKVPGITKNDAGYNKVQRMSVEMRHAGEIPFDWISDNTRWQRRPRSFDNVEDCLNDTARFYRRNLWATADEQVEVWCESDSIAGVITDVTYEWNVPLMVTKGYSSLTFARSAAGAWAQDGRPVTVYYVGDHDPAGLGIETKLLDYFDQWGAAVSWQRVGVTWEQVERYDLPGTEPKKSYGYPLAVEADALPPNDLRGLLDEAIRCHVDPADLELHEIVEAEERDVLQRLARRSA